MPWFVSYHVVDYARADAHRQALSKQVSDARRVANGAYLCSKRVVIHGLSDKEELFNLLYQRGGVLFVEEEAPTSGRYPCVLSFDLSAEDPARGAVDQRIADMKGRRLVPSTYLFALVDGVSLLNDLRNIADGRLKGDVFKLRLSENSVIGVGARTLFSDEENVNDVETRLRNFLPKARP